MKLVCGVFESEYDEIWSSGFEILEEWIELNDDLLEATKERN